MWVMMHSIRLVLCYCSVDACFVRGCLASRCDVGLGCINSTMNQSVCFFLLCAPSGKVVRFSSDGGCVCGVVVVSVILREGAMCDRPVKQGLVDFAPCMFSPLASPLTVFFAPCLARVRWGMPGGKGVKCSAAAILVCFSASIRAHQLMYVHHATYYITSTCSLLIMLIGL